MSHDRLIDIVPSRIRRALRWYSARHRRVDHAPHVGGCSRARV